MTLFGIINYFNDWKTEIFNRLNLSQTKMLNVWDATIKYLLTQIKITEERIRVDVFLIEYAKLVCNDLNSPETTL